MLVRYQLAIIPHPDFLTGEVSIFSGWCADLLKSARRGGASQSPTDVGGKGSSNGESLAPPESYIDPFHISPTEVPAWTVAEVGKQRVNADLVLRREEHELGFAALQADRIIALDSHHSELAPALGDLVPN